MIVYDEHTRGKRAARIALFLLTLLVSTFTYIGFKKFTSNPNTPTSILGDIDLRELTATALTIPTSTPKPTINPTIAPVTASRPTYKSARATATASSSVSSLGTVTSGPYHPKITNGAFVQLFVKPGSCAQVQWLRESDSIWMDVNDGSGGEAWRGDADAQGSIRWFAGTDLLGSGPYRWQVFSEGCGILLHTSPTFHIPVEPGQTVVIRINPE